MKTNNQEEIILIANKLGFESKFLGYKPWKYSTKEPMRYLLWLEEFKHFLAEKHNILFYSVTDNNYLINLETFILTKISNK